MLISVFNKNAVKPEFIETGVYAWVSHPMYLGTLLFCLGFFRTTLSLFSLLVWTVIFVFTTRRWHHIKKQGSFKSLVKNISPIKNKCQDGCPSLKKKIQQIATRMNKFLQQTLRASYSSHLR